MKNYELLTVFKPNLDADDVDKNIVKIKGLVEGFNGSILNVDKIGRKKLAYEIQKFRDGFFVAQVIEIPSDKITEFNRQITLMDSILRTMFLDVTKTYAAK